MAPAAFDARPSCFAPASRGSVDLPFGRALASARVIAPDVFLRKNWLPLRVAWQKDDSLRTERFRLRCSSRSEKPRDNFDLCLLRRTQSIKTDGRKSRRLEIECIGAKTRLAECGQDGHRAFSWSLCDATAIVYQTAPRTPGFVPNTRRSRTCRSDSPN